MPVEFVLLTGKHFNEQMEPGRLVALSLRQAVLAGSSQIPVHSNLVITVAAPPEVGGPAEFYAKAIRLLDGSGNQCLIHFTSVPPKLSAWLRRLVETTEAPPPPAPRPD